jgi:hypothetical protein
VVKENKEEGKCISSKWANMNKGLKNFISISLSFIKETEFFFFGLYSDRK